MYLGSFGHFKKSSFGSHVLFFFPKVKMIYNQDPLILHLNFLFLMKSLSCESTSLCVSVFDQFWECAQSYQGQKP